MSLMFYSLSAFPSLAGGVISAAHRVPAGRLRLYAAVGRSMPIIVPANYMSLIFEDAVAAAASMSASTTSVVSSFENHLYACLIGLLFTQGQSTNQNALPTDAGAVVAALAGGEIDLAAHNIKGSPELFELAGRAVTRCWLGEAVFRQATPRTPAKYTQLMRALLSPPRVSSDLRNDSRLDLDERIMRALQTELTVAAELGLQAMLYHTLWSLPAIAGHISAGSRGGTPTGPAEATTRGAIFGAIASTLAATLYGSVLARGRIVLELLDSRFFQRLMVDVKNRATTDRIADLRDDIAAGLAQIDPAGLSDVVQGYTATTTVEAPKDAAATLGPSGSQSAEGYVLSGPLMAMLLAALGHAGTPNAAKAARHTLEWHLGADLNGEPVPSTVLNAYVAPYLAGSGSSLLGKTSSSMASRAARAFIAALLPIIEEANNALDAASVPLTSLASAGGAAMWPVGLTPPTTALFNPPTTGVIGAAALPGVHSLTSATRPFHEASDLLAGPLMPATRTYLAATARAEDRNALLAGRGGDAAYGDGLISGPALTSPLSLAPRFWATIGYMPPSRARNLPPSLGHYAGEQMGDHAQWNASLLSRGATNPLPTLTALTQAGCVVDSLGVSQASGRVSALRAPAFFGGSEPEDYFRAKATSGRPVLVANCFVGKAMPDAPLGAGFGTLGFPAGAAALFGEGEDTTAASLNMFTEAINALGPLGKTARELVTGYSGAGLFIRLGVADDAGTIEDQAAAIIDRAQAVVASAHSAILPPETIEAFWKGVLDNERARIPGINAQTLHVLIRPYCDWAYGVPIVSLLAACDPDDVILVGLLTDSVHPFNSGVPEAMDQANTGTPALAFIPYRYVPPEPTLAELTFVTDAVNAHYNLYATAYIESPPIGVLAGGFSYVEIPDGGALPSQKLLGAPALMSTLSPYLLSASEGSEGVGKFALLKNAYSVHGTEAAYPESAILALARSGVVSPASYLVPEGTTALTGRAPLTRIETL